MPVNENDESRRCPGEKYGIPRAICKGRQLQRYSKCPTCSYQKADMDARVGTPPPVADIIFKAYDIRGAYPDQINEQLAERVGEATAKFLGAKTIVIGRDMRVSSEPLAKAAIKGVTGFGCNVIDIGLVSTDANYFATGCYNASGGIQITASHNPPNENGLKISREKAMPVGEDSGLQSVKRLVYGPRPRPAAMPGLVEPRDCVKDFARHVLSFARSVPRIKVVIDAGNGMHGRMMPRILDRLPIEPIPMYFELDPTFPHHAANPLKHETLADLQRKIAETHAELGVAFDADGDRCGFVTEKGEILPGDLVTALFARHALKQQPGSAIVYDVRSSWVVDEEVRKAGGVPVRERVGHAFIKATMRKRNAPIGGELSCHYYFRDNYYADSGAIAMIYMLNVLGEEDKPLSELLKPLQRYFASGELDFEVKDKEGKMREVATIFSDAKIQYKDGITVEYKDWWFNVRSSNTQALLRLNLEAKTEPLKEEKLTQVVALLQK